MAVNARSDRPQQLDPRERLANERDRRCVEDVDLSCLANSRLCAFRRPNCRRNRSRLGDAARREVKRFQQSLICRGSQQGLNAYGWRPAPPSQKRAVFSGLVNGPVNGVGV